MSFITIMTDFGLQDGYSGVMHGVIYRIAPDAKITDLSHLIHPQNVLEGSVVWQKNYAYFPEGTVHIGVVDPGVGTHRRPIAARLGKFFFVCPDNGLITPILETAEKSGEPVEIVHLDKPEYWLPKISNVFHGRDIFSPVGAHLANGVPLNTLGTPITDPVRKPIPVPQRMKNGWLGQIVQIDHFGNLAANIHRADLEGIGPLQVHVGNTVIDGLSRTFGDKKTGELIALIDSSDELSICVVNGNAAERLKVNPGETVEVIARQA